MSNIIPVSDIQSMSVAIAKSGLFGAKTPEQAMALMLVAQAEGLHPASAARDYDIIQGRACKKSEAMLRDFLAAGGSVQWHALSDTQAAATFSHPAGGSIRIDWDMKRASTAGLSSKDMWKKYPRNMLRARCVSEGVRTVCPMATGGMYTPEERQDMGAEVPPVVEARDMGEAVVVPRLDDVLTAIQEAATLDALELLRPEIRKLDGDDKKAALAKAKTRADEIRAKAEEDDAAASHGTVAPAEAQA
jgi:hypothetical protein